MTTSSALDASAFDAFTARMSDVLDNAALALMTSLGHRTGLFDAMARLAPSCAEEIAGAAKLDERYVRQWLAAMTSGRIIRYDPQAERYSLPAEHAALLTRSTGPDSLAYRMQYITLLGRLEPRLTRCFREGTGLEREHFGDFDRLREEELRAIHGRGLLRVTLPLVNGSVARLESGIDVLEIGCGRGRATNLMARAFPASRFTGLDPSGESIEAAREEARAWGLSNTRFETRDASDLDDPNAHDLVCAFWSLRDQRDPNRALRQVRAALKSNGRFLWVDAAGHSALHENLDHPLATFSYAVSCIRGVGGSLSGGGAGLGAHWGEHRSVTALHDAGFDRVDVRRSDTEITHNYYVAR